MDTKTEKKLRKLTREQLAAERAEYQALLETDPDNAEVKEVIALIDELLADPAKQPQAPKPSKEKTFEEEHAELITQKVNAGLTREGAIQVIKDQIENDKRRSK